MHVRQFVADEAHPHRSVVVCNDDFNIVDDIRDGAPWTVAKTLADILQPPPYDKVN
jgi:hypothetical protein